MNRIHLHRTKIFVPLLLLCFVGPADLVAVEAQDTSQIEEATEDVLIRLLMSPRRRDDLGMRIKAMDALAKKGTDKALDVVIKLAKGRDPEMRAAAMGSLAIFKGDSKALELLIKGLGDRDPAIRAVTLRALRGVREKVIVDELIEVVGREKEEESIRVSALKLLVRLTNQNMGLVGEDWKKWWELARPRFEFPTEKESDSGFTDVKVRDLSYFGIEVASKRIGFLVDISSSMTQTVAVRSDAEREAEEASRAGATGVVEDSKDKEKDGGGAGKARKIDILKKELVRVLEKLPPDTFVNIVIFDAMFRAWQKQLVPLAGAGRARAISYVQNLNTGSGTNVYDTLEFALQDRRVDTIYLLTDGVPTRGKITEPAKILEEIGVQNRVRGVTIHCIAFGEESKLLEDLAAQNGGAYRFVNRY